MLKQSPIQEKNHIGSLIRNKHFALNQATHFTYKGVLRTLFFAFFIGLLITLCTTHASPIFTKALTNLPPVAALDVADDNANKSDTHLPR
ncbi:MAG: hypothetical protein IT497_08005 [Ottowia sp.]|jgi:hypothetical protein|nr:hypothetical protein [Ottowia sp.]